MLQQVDLSVEYGTVNFQLCFLCIHRFGTVPIIPLFWIRIDFGGLDPDPGGQMTNKIEKNQRVELSSAVFSFMRNKDPSCSFDVQIWRPMKKLIAIFTSKY